MMTLKSILTTLALVAVTTVTGQTTQREALIDRLWTLQQRGTMFGHQDDTFYGLTWKWQPGRSDTQETCGQLPAVMGFELGGIEMDSEVNLDSVPFTLMRQEILAQVARGGIVTISWHPRNPLTGGDAWDTSSAEVVRSVLPGGKCHATFLVWMRRVSAFLASLSPDGQSKTPIIFRPWHENNGSWFWWGRDLCSAQEYHALWCMLQDYLLVEGFDNLVWSYSPNLDGGMTREQFLERYPGDDRTDLLGIDAYQSGTTEEFLKATRADLSMLAAYCSEHHKLVALTECGVKGITPKHWWTEAMLPLAKDYGLSYLLPWRNARKDEYFGPSPKEHDAADFRAFSRDASILFVDDIRPMDSQK